MSRRPSLLLHTKNRLPLQILTTWGCPSMVAWQSSSRASSSCMSSSCCSDTICAAVFPCPLHSSSNTCRREGGQGEDQCLCHLLCLCAHVEGREGAADPISTQMHGLPGRSHHLSHDFPEGWEHLPSANPISWGELAPHGEDGDSGQPGVSSLADSSQATCPPHRVLVMNLA